MVTSRVDQSSLWRRSLSAHRQLLAGQADLAAELQEPVGGESAGVLGAWSANNRSW
jgi:hypothetical protein